MKTIATLILLTLLIVACGKSGDLVRPGDKDDKSDKTPKTQPQ